MAKAKKRKKTAARKPARRKSKPANAGPKSAVALREPHRRWLDSVAESIRVNGGPSFSRGDVLEALIDAVSSRQIDPRAITDRESLRVAFGALDTSKLEAQLRENRPAVDPSVLDALKNTIK